ncbi:MAG: TonB-dependent receptor [Flavobacterium sp.]|uniref:TonB-dependent receptor n=1 Tax=Flavobacterium sp. TaxID=239 RepID=UPI000C3F6D6A|nr:TonB-dependent receptor [Flavobacterium sp.]MBF04590.1 TonB-dependent receptor [Flavobacterium sp.]|tara:strand:+ start:1852 stop:3609 length:1758 start_codon:yes stop_codon:yes gene_type:complete
MSKIKIYFSTTIALFLTYASFSQVKDENIGSEVVNIVKAYTPTISDAFKVKETPVLEDEDNMQKEEIKYNIFSFPVASTFTPAKGKAAAVDKSEREKIYRNYATLGFGNYATANAELFITENFGRNSYVGGMLRHLSSQGGIKNVVLDDKYYNTSLDVTYGTRERDMSWNVDLGLKNQIYNWYGLPTENIVFTDDQIRAIDSQQSYNTIALGGKLTMDKSFLNEASLQFKRFSDAFGSGENRFLVKPNFDIDVMEQKIKANFIVDYVGGTFEKDFQGADEIKYSHVIFGTKPSILYQQDDLSVNLGVGVFYTTGKINGESDGKIFVYPNVKASYRIVGDILVGYAGAEGGLNQNSYAEFVDQNPFVSPTLLVGPTDNKYDVYVGLKGKLANAVAFNVRGSIKNEDYKPLFVSNTYVFGNTNTEGYTHGNSFEVVYDNVKTVSIFGEIKADFSKHVSFGINGTYNNYTTDNQSEAWNLPQLNIGTTLDFDITDKWYAGANIFFVGERKDRVSVQDISAVFPPNFQLQEVTLDSYFDLNAHIGYKYNERLTAFLRGNNLANQQYNRWANYPVQGVQVVLGANYKFDF